MATDIKYIESIEHPDNPENIKVTVFWAGAEKGTCIQLSIGDKFAMLDYESVTQLINSLETL